MASAHAGHGGAGVNLLPGPLGAVAVLIYLAILLAHLRHARESSGQRRFWHLGHVAMAVGMTYMFVPGSALPFTIADGRWQALYGAGLVLVTGWLVWQTLMRAGASGLWLLLAADLAAMLYMFSPGATRGSISWILIAYLTAEALGWASGRVAGADRNVLPGGAYSATIVATAGGGGAVQGASVATATATAAAKLACERDLRLSMGGMTIGMAYMVLAMLVMR